MKIALVHDYIKEFGGAERVLEALHEIWPQAPIYTAFAVKNSVAGKAFAKAKIRESKFAPWLKHHNLYSPLRFLTPWIWKSFNLSSYDLVISSSSWYIARGFKVGPKTKVICYCHTPPRWLYGFKTSVEWQRFWPIRVYGQILAHFLRLYDFKTAQKVDQFIANSQNVQKRIEKFYRRSSQVIYPPVEVEKIKKVTQDLKPQDYYLIVSRVVGAKGIKLAIKAALEAKVKLKIVGEAAGLSWLKKDLDKIRDKNIKFLGRLEDEQLFKLYGQCKAFLALAEDEDFGITPVEAMAAGRPIIAFRGGGYLESVIEGKTGMFVNKLTVEEIVKLLNCPTCNAMRSIAGRQIAKLEKINPEDCRKQAEKFSKERFKKEIQKFIKGKTK
jgi:glycosyltransferase involved in cell wall biosynthesis